MLSSEQMEVCESGREVDEDFTLSSFPVEILLHICSYLSVKDMVLGLSKVCKRFQEILNDENLWKSWIQRRWGSRYPIVTTNDSFKWKEACFEIEKEWQWWSPDNTLNPADKEYLVAGEVHISCVDAVVFMDAATCVSSSRDRSIVVWKPLDSLTGGRHLSYVQKDLAHDGWIWRMINIGNKLYSCSWDTTVKVWGVDTTIHEIQHFKCFSPVLSMTNGKDGLIYAGEYGKLVHGFDPRAGTEPVLSYTPHARPVLTLGANETDIVSGGEDKFLAVWDKRMRTIRQRIELGKNCFSSSSSVDNTALYVGDNKGSVHAFSCTGPEVTRIATFKIGHTKPISVVKHGVGHLITASLDSTVKMHLPTNPPTLVNTLKTTGEIGGLDYVDGILGVGGSVAVEFWVPRSALQTRE